MLKKLFQTRIQEIKSGKIMCKDKNIGELADLLTDFSAFSNINLIFF
jgi:hypothetical protein